MVGAHVARSWRSSAASFSSRWNWLLFSLVELCFRKQERGLAQQRPEGTKPRRSWRGMAHRLNTSLSDVAEFVLVKCKHATIPPCVFKTWVV